MLCPFCFWIPPPTHAHALSLCTAPRNCCRTRLDLSDFTEEERRKADRQANEIGECVFEIFCVCVCVCMCVCVWRLQQTGLTLILNCRFMPYTPTHCTCLAPPPHFSFHHHPHPMPPPWRPHFNLAERKKRSRGQRKTMADATRLTDDVCAHPLQCSCSCVHACMPVCAVSFVCLFVLLAGVCTQSAHACFPAFPLCL